MANVAYVCCSRCYSLRPETRSVASNFKGGPYFPHFSQAHFFDRTDLRLIEKQERL